MRAISALLRSPTRLRAAANPPPPVASEPIVDALAAASTLYERGAAQELQMSRCIREGEARVGCQILDAALALPEMFEQLEPMRMGNLGEICNNKND
jgi:hypothetical protein